MDRLEKLQRSPDLSLLQGPDVGDIKKDESRRGGEIGKEETTGFDSLSLLPCDAMRCTILVIVILSVRLSVCLSDCLSATLVDCVHMVLPTITISSPYGSPTIPVSGDITFIPKFEGGNPEQGR